MFDELQKQCELASWWMRRPKKDSMSALWQWSDIIVVVVCKLCLATVSTSGGNTTNLFNHLKRKHPKEHAECVFYSQPHSSVSLEIPVIIDRCIRAAEEI